MFLREAGDELWLDLLDEPILAPSRQVDLRLCRLVGDQVEHLLQLIATDANNLVWHVDEDAADELVLASLALLLNPLQLCLLVANSIARIALPISLNG